VPAAVLITGAGTVGRHAGVRLGHFAASRWRTDGEVMLGEVFVGGEGLSRGAREVLATLLHEAAHGLADQRQIRDTSRQGRYHNQRFKRLAEELGLQVDHHPTLGWSPTTLPETTARRYATAIDALEAGADGASRGRADPPAPAARLSALPVRVRQANPDRTGCARARACDLRLVLSAVRAGCEQGVIR
jgi:hypothetical protein